jgi:predicted ATPase
MEWLHCHIARKPMPPAVKVDQLPSQVSAIVMKLLAKTPEERYQTAAGVERDLRRCLEDWESRHAIAEFPLGERDRANRLLIPEKLYGRQHEIETLLAAFDRVVMAGTARLFLICGPAGIGKSSVVNELHKSLLPRHGLFGSGKCDQFKRDVPYATVAEALRALTRRLLSMPEAELSRWRNDLIEALDPDGAAVVDLVPELKFVIGAQPTIPDGLTPAPSAHFQLALRRLIGVFASADHPLVLFLDDLQWVDTATLDLLEGVLGQAERQHLLVIGAYRDKEVDEAHPLTRRFSALRDTETQLQRIVLAPLNRDDLAHLIADTLGCETPRAMPLAQMVHEKTGGNPFFVNQFVHQLVDRRLITFDPDRAAWQWDLGPIRANVLTDNLVELIVGKLSRLPERTQQAVKGLACLGNSADASMLAMVQGRSLEELRSDLWEALHQELIIHSGSRYRFLHDRVQEAAYSLLPEEQRAPAHLAIGRLLLAAIEPDKREDNIFEIVGHLNRGSPLMASGDDREELAALNLMAGKRAMTAAAYASALNYLAAGAALVPEDSRERLRDLAFELELHRAACEFMTGRMADAEERLVAVSPRATSALERAAVACLLADIYFTRQRPDLGLATCLECLRHAGLDFPNSPTDQQAQAAYDHILSRIEGRAIDELANLPVMTDPTTRATLDVLAKIIPCALGMDSNLLTLIVCAAIDLSLEHGNCDSSCFVYGHFGFVADGLFGNVEVGFAFGRLGYKVVERHGPAAVRCCGPSSFRESGTVGETPRNQRPSDAQRFHPRQQDRRSARGRRERCDARLVRARGR